MKNEPTNSDRAAWARRTLATFVMAMGGKTISELHPLDVNDAISDLICDLLHLADQNGLDPKTITGQALSNFAAELSEARPKLIYVPEDTQPTVATEGNRSAIAYLELQNDGSEHYYGTLFAASENMLAALKQAVTALNTAPRFKVPSLDSDSYAVAAMCDRAIPKVSRPPSRREDA